MGKPMTTAQKVKTAAVFFVLGCVMTALGSTVVRARSSAPQNFVVADMTVCFKGSTPESQACLQQQLNAYSKGGWTYVGTTIGNFLLFAK
jgi:hypothetical protein